RPPRGPAAEAGAGRSHGGGRTGVSAFADAADRLAVDRRMHHARGTGAHAAVDDGRGLVRLGAVADFGEQRVKACAVAEFDAGGVAPLRRIEVARQGNLRIARMARIPDPVLRTPK